MRFRKIGKLRKQNIFVNKLLVIPRKYRIGKHYSHKNYIRVTEKVKTKPAEI
jgi:hypothetical protein